MCYGFPVCFPQNWMILPSFDQGPPHPVLCIRRIYGMSRMLVRDLCFNLLVATLSTFGKEVIDVQQKSIFEDHKNRYRMI